VHFLRRMGFVEAAQLPGFIRGRDGRLWDMLIMAYHLTPQETAANL
jgi:hypothetical protein